MDAPAAISTISTTAAAATAAAVGFPTHGIRVCRPCHKNFTFDLCLEFHIQVQQSFCTRLILTSAASSQTYSATIVFARISAAATAAATHTEAGQQ